MKFTEIREKYRSKYPASLVAAAVKIAIDMGGAMTPAVKKIEAMKRGLSDDPIVKDALRMANESVNEGMSLDRLKKKFKGDIDNYNKRNKPLPKNVEKALHMFAVQNGEVKSDDPDEFEDWLMQNIEENVNEDYAQDLDLAQKNMARLAKKETGQNKKDYMAVARALNQGNLGAVKKVIKGISTDEIKADILNVLVGYNDLIAKMYPKAVDAKGRLKTPMSVSKMIKDDVNEALGNKNPSHREKLKLDKDGTVHNLPGKKMGSAYSIKPRIDGGVLKFGTVDNFGNINTMTMKELLKVLK